ncbi:hypothetical protein ACSBR2_021772 [Camellia fascicularis]
MFYRLPRYKNCHLGNNKELQNMLLLGEAFEFRIVLCKYAVQCGFKFKYLKNNSKRITAICSHRDNGGCLWLSSDLVSNVISKRVRDRPLTRPTDVAYTFKADYGLDISYHVAWLGVEKAREAMHSDYLTSFDQLRWYGDAVQHYNPGSHINIDYDSKTSQFKRFFVAFVACINGFKYCRPLLFLDGAFLKERYKGQFLAKTANDSNQGLFPVAFAIVDSKSKSNWSWFLYELSKVIADDICITFVFDRNLGFWKQCQRHSHQHIMDERREIANKWNGIICPTFETNLQDSFNTSRSWNVSKANDDVFKVYSFPSVTVDIERRVCSCYQ